MSTAEQLKQSLAKVNEIEISVMGRKSGRWISRPVWFVLEGDKLELLPVSGSDTEWFKNLLQNPKIRIKAGDAEGEFPAILLTESRSVDPVVEQFRKKYGVSDVKKYYTKFDRAVFTTLT